MKTETRGPLAQWVHDELLSMSSQEFNVLMAKAREQDRKMAALVEFVEGIAAESCCQTPGCSEDDPRCTTMEARAALVAVKGEPR